MQRGGDSSNGGLGPQLVGEKITINRRITSVARQLGEGEKRIIHQLGSLIYIIALVFWIEAQQHQLVTCEIYNRRKVGFHSCI